MLCRLPAILTSSNFGSSARPARILGGATGATPRGSSPRQLNRYGLTLGDLQGFAQSLVEDGLAPFDELKRVRRFTSRKDAGARIWAAVARLSPDAAQPASDVAPALSLLHEASKRPQVLKARARTRKSINRH